MPHMEMRGVVFAKIDENGNTEKGEIVGILSRSFLKKMWVKII